MKFVNMKCCTLYKEKLEKFKVFVTSTVSNMVFLKWSLLLFLPIKWKGTKHEMHFQYYILFEMLN